ncbi:MAG: ATP-binding cassette domain-containing protein [Akkermansia sp.]|nr:ATP-binding cassette domain-containing protein [Akkermansia sp.]
MKMKDFTQFLTDVVAFLGNARAMAWDAVLRGHRSLVHAYSSLIAFAQEAPRRFVPKNESDRAHAGIIADLFASILGQIENPGADMLYAAMDILRYDFPNVEHIWLAERFRKSYEARYPLQTTLAVAVAHRTQEERIALALEVYTLLHRIGENENTPALFEEVANGLNLPGAARIIAKLVNTPGMVATRPVESLSFSTDISAGNVQLPPEEDGVRFRVLHCVNLLLVVNDGVKPISVRGRYLQKGDTLPLSQGQKVELGSCHFSYRTMRSLLQAQYSGMMLVYYLEMEGDMVSITRQRPLNCIAKLKFGVHVEIEIMRHDVQFVLDGKLLHYGDSVGTSFYTPFTVQGQGPFTFASLADKDPTGHSFQLDPGNRRILVSNMPYMNRPGALMLTPGLAPGTVFEVTYSRNTGVLRVLEGDAHSITVGDQPVRGDTKLIDGDLIGLSAVQYLRCRFSAGVLEEESSAVSTLRVRGLSRDFVRAGRVVNNIDFSLKRGEMACVLGPSGSGKSTLLSMLAGHLEPTIGTITYNSEQLTPNSQNLRRYIAFIPREDILDEAMTVEEHVYQASIARRPLLSPADRLRRTLAVLNFVGISHLAKRNVGRAGERTISDGERTRLNLGLDLTGTAEVFLIDEPISGLSSGDAERVIQTLENMTYGRMLICTLHRPAQVLLNRFTKVMVLDPHGKMAFWGSPQEMVDYFRNAAEELELHVTKEAVAAGGADYVFEVLDAPFRTLDNRLDVSPDLWQERYEAYAYSRTVENAHAESPKEQPKPIPVMPRRRPAELWRLFCMWVSRTFLSRLRSRMGLYALLLEGPVLALLIAGTLRAATDAPYTFYKSLHITEYLFLSLVLAMFFGLTDSACEILRDRPILRRESNYKLFTGGYLLAKTLVLTGIAGLQCALYLWVGNAVLGIYSMFWEHFLVMLLTAFVGISLSLCVSAFVRSERTALNIVPLLLVPQILLAGALVRFEEMNEFSPNIPQGVLPAALDHKLSTMRHRVAYQDETTHNISSKPVPLIAEFCPLRYAFEMMFVMQTSDNLWDRENNYVNEFRDELKEHGTEEDLRFIQRAALAFNGMAANDEEARSLLRRVRKAALTMDEKFLEQITAEQENRPPNAADHPAEFFFSNRKLASVREGVKTARKDSRSDENRGFFLAPRQPAPFASFDQDTDSGSVSTIGRNSVYLFFMGLIPILIAARRLKAICKGK